EDELYFLAPGCAPNSVRLHSLARHIERGGRPAVLFTGFQGDEVWALDPWELAYQTAGVVRGDTTALMLSEIRLKSGFVNVAVPALFARGIRDLAALIAAPDLAPWRPGGTYDPPTPRRLLDRARLPPRPFRSRSQRLAAVLRSRKVGPASVYRHRVPRYGAAPAARRFERSP